MIANPRDPALVVDLANVSGVQPPVLVDELGGAGGVLVVAGNVVCAPEAEFFGMEGGSILRPTFPGVHQSVPKAR